MDDRSAATIGFVVAGLAFVAVFAGVVLSNPFLSWPSNREIPAVVLAVVPFVVFAGRRYGIMERQFGSILAGIAGLLLGAFAIWVVFEAVSSQSGSIVGPVLTVAGGIGVVIIAYADWRTVSGDRLGRMGRTTIKASLVGVSGLLAIIIWGSLIALVLQAVAGPDIEPSVGIALSTIALGLGTGSVAVLYLHRSHHSFDYIDLKRLTLRDGGVVIGGVVALIGLNVVISLVFQTLGLQAATHALLQAAQSNPEILLVLIPLSYLVIGPGEELLYRNIVQKMLYESFSRLGAIIVASAIFAGVHFFAFFGSGSTLLGTMNTLIVVFVLSIVLGVVYDMTRNVLVSALVHGSFDAIAFAVTYAQITGILT